MDGGKKIDDLRRHQMERLSQGTERRAAVLIPLVYQNGVWNLLFEVRARNIVQGGEICFPGGGIASSSGESAEDAAVRETMEELLVSREQIDLICPMFQLTGPGGTEVYSYLGILRDYKGTFSKDEVSAVFMKPLSWFRENPPREYHAKLVTVPPDNFPFDELPDGINYPFREVPKTFCFYTTECGTLWGMTAQLTQAAVRLLGGTPGGNL